MQVIECSTLCLYELLWGFAFVFNVVNITDRILNALNGKLLWRALRLWMSILLTITITVSFIITWQTQTIQKKNLMPQSTKTTQRVTQNYNVVNYHPVTSEQVLFHAINFRFQHFYRAAWNADAVLRWEFRPSVRLSVRPSNACIVTKRKKAMFRFLYHMKEHLS